MSEFAISRKTGYKIFDRYKESGLEARMDGSRRPGRYGSQLPQQAETAKNPMSYGALTTKASSGWATKNIATL